MTEQAIVTLYGECFCLGLDMQLFRNETLVRFPIVGYYFSDFNILDGIPELFSGCCTVIAQYAVDEFFPISINSNPYPAAVFFEEI
jgi:hypothetical protein